ncbi:methylated-DNA--[protein]-cysteine S-methyltransferase [Actinomyces oricola]
MHYLSGYLSPLGPMTLACRVGEGMPDGGAVTGAWFDGQEHDREGLPDGAVSLKPGDEEPVVLAQARAWLDAYFAGHDPGPPPAVAPHGTAFQERVWAQLRLIPRGATTTYGAIAADIEAASGGRCSARAVGGAVGRNPVSILVPCHRVLGANGSLTGYAGGTGRKTALLRLEGAAIPDAGQPQDHPTRDH